MNISVEESLPDGSKFRFTVIVGEGKGNQMIAAELLEYQPVHSHDYMMVLPKVAQMTNEEKFIMRGTFREIFVNQDNDYVFEIPISKLFRIRSEVWQKAENFIEFIEQQKVLIK